MTSQQGFAITGFLDDDPALVLPDRWRFRGRFADLEAVLQSDVIDEVTISLLFLRWDLVAPVIGVAEEHGKIVRVPMDVLDRASTSGTVEELDGTPVFSLVDDPRVTRLGAFFRRTSLDELPQLWNVRRGKMSLVGPRPAPPREVAGYDVWHRRRLSMKPGITGLWQVGARRDGEFDDRASLDLDCIDRWSTWMDVKIMTRTIPAAQEGR